MGYIYLIVAIALEIVGTTALQASQQFTRLWPSLLTLVTYGGAFFLLSLALRTFPVGIAYAIWSGLGIVLISLVGRFWFNQHLDGPAVLGLGLIIAGVVVVNVFSKTVTH